MNTILVEPKTLEDKASKLEAACADYENIYTNLYGEIERMSSLWSGKDNEAYTNQIISYKKDFNRIKMIIKNYAIFLRNCARAYRETQDELYNQAIKL